MTDTIEQYMNVGMAAAHLSEQLKDKTPEQYTLMLNSNRVKSRAVAYRIPYEKIGGGVAYAVEELEKYIALQKSRTIGTVKLSTKAAEALQAVGFNEAGGSSTGRRFNPTDLILAIDEVTKKHFMQLILSDPLRVYRVEVEAAQFLNRELTELLSVVERHQREREQQQPDLGKYETVTDNQDVLVMRRVTK